VIMGEDCTNAVPGSGAACDPIDKAAGLLDGQIDFYCNRAAGASKAGADLLAMRACRAALAVRRGGVAREDDAASLAACSRARARAVLDWLASTWRTTPYAVGNGFRARNWMAWTPLNMLLTGPDAVNVFGQPDPAPVPVRKGGKAGQKAGQKAPQKAPQKAMAQRRGDPSAWKAAR
jgi:hypothetical protein